MKVRFLSVAERELADAFDWYEQAQPGLGYALIDELDRVIHRIVAFPDSCQMMGDGLRRVLINRFPYGLWYDIEKDELVVYAFAHLHRKPRHHV
jgi:plasmid stabilization system protein ParE